MPKRILYFQCVAGISGDMHLAALIALGVPEAHLFQELSKLGIDSEFTLQVSSSEKKGIHGTRLDVELHGHHSHEHKDSHEHKHSHSMHQRDYKDIKALIAASSLAGRVKERALAIFEEVAKAEALIHNQTVNEVHFHEVGATDSIVDIVGAAIGLEYLIEQHKIDYIQSSRVELGSGMVNCAHGTYPVPAPATAKILQGVPVSSGQVKGEATTPTGAAILKACVNEFSDEVQGTILDSVYGIGHRDTNVPNVLRALLLESEEVADIDAPKATGYAKIEANIDDMSPEAFGPLYDRLFEAGASDVFLQNIVMKKSRPAHMLCVLGSSRNIDGLAEVVLNNSTSIGLRILPFKKKILPREVLLVPTSLGQVSIKLVIQPDGQRRWKSEHDHIVRIAGETGQPYPLVKKQVDQEIDSYLKEQGHEVSKRKEVKSSNE